MFQYYEYFLFKITERQFVNERPLPSTPSDDASDSSEDSISDELEDEDESVSETKDLPTNGSALSYKNHVSPSSEFNNCSSTMYVHTHICTFHFYYLFKLMYK